MDHMTGMLSADTGLLKMREKYNMYKVDTEAQGRPALPFEQWLSLMRGMPPVAAPQPAAPMMPVRGGPSSSFQDPYAAQLAADRARAKAEYDAAIAAARAKRQPGMITGR
mgnify:CR=1 FL=1